jgi:hypothetical protein
MKQSLLLLLFFPTLALPSFQRNGAATPPGGDAAAFQFDERQAFDAQALPP